MLTFSAAFPNDREILPESIAAKWKEITTFGMLMI
jgi:hypothetical protein